MFYFIGRTLQVIGLVTMPSAIWAAAVYHNERACIQIFTASLAVFLSGYFFARIRRQ